MKYEFLLREQWAILYVLYCILHFILCILYLLLLLSSSFRYWAILLLLLLLRRGRLHISYNNDMMYTYM